MAEYYDGDLGGVPLINRLLPVNKGFDPNTPYVATPNTGGPGMQTAQYAPPPNQGVLTGFKNWLVGADSTSGQPSSTTPSGGQPNIERDLVILGLVLGVVFVLKH